MATGRTGNHGATVLLHVEEECKTDQGPVRILRRHLVAKHVQEKARKQDHVTKILAQVNYVFYNKLFSNILKSCLFFFLLKHYPKVFSRQLVRLGGLERLPCLVRGRSAGKNKNLYQSPTGLWGDVVSSRGWRIEAMQ